MNSHSLYFFAPWTIFTPSVSACVPPPTPVSKPPITGPSQGPVGFSSAMGFTTWLNDEEKVEEVDETDEGAWPGFEV